MRRKMRHRIDTERNLASGKDDWNAPLPPDWKPHLTGIPGYWWGRILPLSGEIRDVDRAAVRGDYQLAVPHGTDLTEEDRIVAVRTKRGAVIWSGILDVRLVIRRPDHLLAVLVEFR